MANIDLLDKIAMGSVVTFTYKKPGVQMGSRVGIMLTPFYRGHVHVLKLAALTSTEKESIMQVFANMYVNPDEIAGSVNASMQRNLQEIQILKEKGMELLKNGQGVVMRPANQGMMGRAATAAKNAFGAIVGTIKTFGRTPMQPQPMAQNPAVMREIEINKKALELKQQEYYEWAAYLQAQKSKFAAAGRLPRDPYSIYHNMIKAMIPSVRLKNTYRKYDRRYISNPRVVEAPPGTVYGT